MTERPVRYNVTINYANGHPNMALDMRHGDQITLRVAADDFKDASIDLVMFYANAPDSFGEKRGDAICGWARDDQLAESGVGTCEGGFYQILPNPDDSAEVTLMDDDPAPIASRRRVWFGVGGTVTDKDDVRHPWYTDPELINRPGGG